MSGDPQIDPPAAVLSDREILDEMERGNIVISPFSSVSLSNCSYGQIFFFFLARLLVSDLRF